MAVHRLHQRLKRKFPWINYTNLLKSFTSYFIGTQFLLIPYLYLIVSSDVRYLIWLPVSILWNDVSKSVGAMIESTIYFIVSVTCCTLFSWILLTYVQTFSLALMMILFMVAVTVLALIRAKYEKNAMVATNVGISLLILQVTNGHYDYSVTGHISTERLFSYYKSSLSGALISLACNIFIYPKWAAEDLHEGLIKGLKDIKNLLTLVTRSVVEYRSNTKLDHTLHNEYMPSISYLSMSSEERKAKQRQLKEGIAQCRSGFNKITSALKESKLEISYYYCDPGFYYSLTSLIRRMLKNLSLVGSTCQILLLYEESEDTDQARISLHEELFNKAKESPLLMDWIQVMMRPLHDLSEICIDEIDKILYILDPASRPRLIRVSSTADLESSMSAQWKDEQSKLPSSSHLNCSSSSFCTKPHKSDVLHPEVHPQPPHRPNDNSALLRAIENFSHQLSLFLSASIDPKAPSSSSLSSPSMETVLNSESLFQNKQLKRSHSIGGASSLSAINSDPPDAMDQALFIYSYNLGLCQFASTLSLWCNLSSSFSYKRKLYFPLWNRLRVWLGWEEEQVDFDELSYGHPLETDTISEKASIKSGLSQPRQASKSGHFSLFKGFNLLALSLSIKSSKSLLYALRLACVVTFWTLFAMFDDTRDMFHQWRGHWALVTLAVIMTPTIGTSFSLGWYRFLGSLVGGVWACITWSLYHDVLSSVYLLVISTIVFALPCLAIRQHPKMRRLGTVSLMAFTIVLFSAYVLYLTGRDPTEPSPFNEHHPSSSSPLDSTSLNTVFILAFKRCTMISFGVLLSILSSAFLFPSFARTELRIQLASFIHESGYFYSKLISASVDDSKAPPLHSAQRNELGPSRGHRYDAGAAASTSALLSNASLRAECIQSFWIPFEFHLHSSLSKCDAWLSLAQSEWWISSKMAPGTQWTSVTPFRDHRVTVEEDGRRGGGRSTLHGAVSQRQKSDKLQKIYESMLERWQQLLDRLSMIRLLVAHMKQSTHPSETQARSTPVPSDALYDALLGDILAAFYHLSVSLHAKMPLPFTSANLNLKRHAWLKELQKERLGADNRDGCAGVSAAHSPVLNKPGDEDDFWIMLALTSIVKDLDALEKFEAVLFDRVDYKQARRMHQ